MHRKKSPSDRQLQNGKHGHGVPKHLSSKMANIRPVNDKAGASRFLARVEGQLSAGQVSMLDDLVRDPVVPDGVAIARIAKARKDAKRERLKALSQRTHQRALRDG